MKRIYSTIAILAISSLTLFTSCKKTDDEEMITPAQVEAKVALNETTAPTGTETLYVKRDKNSAIIQVSAVSKTTTDMKRIYVFKKANTTDGEGAYVTYKNDKLKKDSKDNYYYDIPTNERNNTSLNLDITLNANNSKASTDVYYFAFTDGSNFVSPDNTAGLLVGPATIVISYGLLSETTGHRISNIQGPNSGAFNLIDLSNKSATDPASGKDIIDMDAATALWEKSFSSGASSTTFVKLPANFDYANATDLSIKSEFKSGTSSDKVTGVATGDMYVANIRGTDNNYAVIKVTSISEENGKTGSGENNEFMEFSVKK